MITEKDIVHIGDKLKINSWDSPYILAQVSINLFILIDINNGNRYVDPFPCTYDDESDLYGSFTINSLKKAMKLKEDDKIEIVERFCADHVFTKLAKLWNEKLGYGEED